MFQTRVSSKLISFLEGFINKFLGVMSARWRSGSALGP